MIGTAAPKFLPTASHSVFVMMYEQPKKPEQTKAAIEFFTWALEEGKPQAEELHYVSLPDNLVKQIEAYWAKEIK